MKKKLAALIHAVALRHACGLRVLLGVAPAPTNECWRLLLAPPDGPRGERVMKTRPTDGFLPALAGALDAEAIIEAAGGWEAVVRAARFVRDRYGDDWGIYAEMILAAAVAPSRLPESATARVKRIFGVDRKTAYRRLRTVPDLVATVALGGFADMISAEEAEGY